MSYGRAVSRAGDYFGHTVNLASRILSVATASEVLVTDECPAQTSAFEFVEPRDATLRGIREPVRLWRVAARAGERAQIVTK
jgi:adenylate cyclase